MQRNIRKGSGGKTKVTSWIFISIELIPFRPITTSHVFPRLDRLVLRALCVFILELMKPHGLRALASQDGDWDRVEHTQWLFFAVICDLTASAPWPPWPPWPAAIEVASFSKLNEMILLRSKRSQLVAEDLDLGCFWRCWRLKISNY